MPCDTQMAQGQTITERKTEIKTAVERLDAEIRSRVTGVKIGPQGAIVFTGWTDRNRVTDACAYRRIMATGSALARAEIAKAETLAGRSVSRQTVAAGVHSHDGGHTWHGKG